MTDRGWSSIMTTSYDPLKAGSIDGTDKEPHDTGIVRAMEAEYFPSERIEGKSEYTVFVARLNPRTTDDVLEKFFSRFGEIIGVRIVRDVVTGFSKRYAFIEFKHSSDARRASHNAHGELVDQFELFTDMECERRLEGWIPRRLGGGFGGRKESGQLRFGCKDRPFKKPYSLFQEKTQNIERPRQENYHPTSGRQESQHRSSRHEGGSSRHEGGSSRHEGGSSRRRRRSRSRSRSPRRRSRDRR